MKIFKNVRKEKLKSNKGAISLLVAITIFTFMAILTGTFITISILRRSQADSNARIKSIYEADYERVDEVYNELTSNAKTADGSWNGKKKVNSPQLEGTGLIPIYWEDDGTQVELDENSTDVQWNKWYDYNKNKWANAVTKDVNGNITGYFVWIPRFAYKITDSLNMGGENISGNINVKFVDMENTDENGVGYSEAYPTIKEASMDNYVVHPAFTGNINAGGWDEDIPGFWVSKYPAGFQANTVEINNDTFYTVNGLDSVASSSSLYTSVDENKNALGDIVVNSTRLSFPVFKPLTYTYNMISIGDSYTISRDIQNATSFYSMHNIDSHLEKNSEWGAVAYLTLSKYGRNGNKININNFYIDSDEKNRLTITGVYASGTNNNQTTNIADVKAYNTDVGKNGSSTANIYGVYDLNGCVFERVAAYISNSNQNLTTYGASFTTTGTTKYATAYTNTLFGDAVVETSQSGTENSSWNGDFSIYPTGDSPFFIRGGRYFDKVSVNSYNKTGGYPINNSGFRVVLIADQSTYQSSYQATN